MSLFYNILIINLKLFHLERHLTHAQRMFSGSRCSDHIAMLNAFTLWSRISRRGPEAEQNFCEQKQISLPTMRVTSEAKVNINISYLL